MNTSSWYQFNALTVDQLYDILQLREQVFTLGQKCSEPDIDNVDRTALHYVRYANEKLVAYLRVYAAGDKLKLGRIVVHPSYQGKGLGKEMMVEALGYLRREYPDQDLEMSAQAYLEKFYQAHGFETVSDIYLEAGIEHLRMRLQQTRNQ